MTVPFFRDDPSDLTSSHYSIIAEISTIDDNNSAMRGYIPL